VSAQEDSVRAIPFENFPVRPFRQEGESLQGWVHRFYAENGRTTPLVMRRFLDRVYRNGRSALTPPQSDLSKVFGKYIRGALELRSNPLVLRYVGLQFCPQCLKTWPFHQEIWEYVGVQACPVHGCELLRACEACGRPFDTALFVNNFHCPCGISLISDSGTQIQPAFVRLARQVAVLGKAELPYPQGSGWLRPDRLPLAGTYIVMLEILTRKYREAFPDAHELPQKLVLGEVTDFALDEAELINEFIGMSFEYFALVFKALPKKIARPPYDEQEDAWYSYLLHIFRMIWVTRVWGMQV
jgi:hypothetical protein